MEIITVRMHSSGENSPTPDIYGNSPDREYYYLSEKQHNKHGRYTYHGRNHSHHHAGQYRRLGLTLIF